MKKFGRLSLLILTPLLLTSCSKNPHAIRALRNYDLLASLDDENLVDDGMVKTNANFLLDLFLGEISFVLFIHDPYCGACRETTANFLTYLKERNYLIFSYDYSLGDYDTLVRYDPIHFPESMFTVPRVYIFKKGYYVDSVNQNKLMNYSFFKPAIDSFSYKPLGNFAYTLKGIQKFEEDYPEGEIVTYYSSLYDQTKEIYSSYYYNNQKQDYLLVDLSLADQDVKNYLL